MTRAGWLALIFFGFLAYFNAVRHPFVHDDVIFILNNPHITEFDQWLKAFKASAVADGLNMYYRPVLEILYRLEYHFFGPHPFGFHLFNVIVHIVNGLLLFSLLQKLAYPKHIAWVVALLFLIHPVQTEAVSCISGISNLWMTLGILLALHAYLNKWYVTTMAFFLIAFLSKEQGILFFPLVIVIDYSRGEKNHFQWFIFGLATFILLWLRQSVTGASLLKDITVSPGELYLRLAAIPRDMGMYLRLIFFPYDLHYYRSTDILKPNTVAWIMALISVLGFFYALRRWPRARLNSTVIPAKAGIHSTLIFGFGWFIAALLPVLNVVPLINEYSFILTPEHFLYLPIVGLLIIVACAVDHYLTLLVIPANAGIYKKILLSMIVSICFLLTWHQNTFWGSEITLFERMLRFEPNFGRGHLLLAKAYSFNGHFLDADQHFQRAFTIMSGYAKKATNSTSKNFYLRYLDEIQFYWALNDGTLQARRNLQRLGPQSEQNFYLDEDA